MRIEAWTLRQSAKTSHKGIILCDVNWDDSDDAAFLVRTQEALDLIEAKDARRFRRVQKEIRYIVNQELTSGGRYRRATKCCLVDFGRYQFDKNPDWYICLYAGMIVHEATHGALYSRGIQYVPENREQIERICHAEEHHFMRRATPHWLAYLSDEYDASKWHFLWHASKWAQMKAVLRRITESKQKANKSVDHYVSSAADGG